ncbi:hypothetical protein COI69_27565 [Bacillus cereus]|uniref:Uncharacterized protein n=2 Tax=Bacillus cereus group TaxID=86661 RepID=A0A9X7E1K3_BACCE|nr:hypothetical protein [Bacillus thuringiensis]PEL98858.1 hypothetical protein CN602_20685 [Bacillus cereus]PFT45680.1 hypothetical protein COK72_14540 [Bacillus thuringiensis]PFX72342.1 hypothetical protein COL39_19165 [Bacillus cereus]PHA14902.1 hypothetical protein COE70_26765 [Bacillus cereus]
MKRNYLLLIQNIALIIFFETEDRKADIYRKEDIDE